MYVTVLKGLKAMSLGHIPCRIANYCYHGNGLRATDEMWRSQVELHWWQSENSDNSN